MSTLMTWKSYAIVSGAGLVATYLASWAPTPSSERNVITPEQAVRSSTAASDIENEAARLQVRVRAEAAYRDPSRNPFRFGIVPVAPRPAARPSAPAEPAAAAPVVTASPVIILSGIASDIVNGVTERTAILSRDGQVLLVRAGDSAGPDHRVRTIETDAIELESTSDGSVTLLRLSMPNP
jgi:hypothetical protein